MEQYDCQKQRQLGHYFRVISAGPRVDSAPPKCYYASPLSIHYCSPLRLRSNSLELRSRKRSEKKKLPKPKPTEIFGCAKLLDSPKAEYLAQNKHPLTRSYREKVKPKLISMECYQRPSTAPARMAPKPSTSILAPKSIQSSKSSLDKRSLNDGYEFTSTSSIVSSSGRVSTARNGSLRGAPSTSAPVINSGAAATSDRRHQINVFKENVVNDIIRRSTYTDRLIMDVIESHARCAPNMSTDTISEAVRETMDDLGVPRHLCRFTLVRVSKEETKEDYVEKYMAGLMFDFEQCDSSISSENECDSNAEED